jgi:hypothetical protein
MNQPSYNVVTSLPAIYLKQTLYVEQMPKLLAVQYPTASTVSFLQDHNLQEKRQ